MKSIYLLIKGVLLTLTVIALISATSVKLNTIYCIRKISAGIGACNATPFLGTESPTGVSHYGRAKPVGQACATLVCDTKILLENETL